MNKNTEKATFDHQQDWQKLFVLLPTFQCDDEFLSEKERNQEIATRDPFNEF